MSIELTLEVRNAKLVRKGLQDLTREVAKVGRQDVYNALMEVTRAVKHEPPAPVRRPRYAEHVRWWGVETITMGTKGRGPWVPWPEPGTREQWYRVMADWREGKINIPYRRTHRFRYSWRVRRYGVEGWRIYSVSPYAQLVAGGPMGEPQAAIHENRWAHFRSELEWEMEELGYDLQRHFSSVARGLGFTWNTNA